VAAERFLGTPTSSGLSTNNACVHMATFAQGGVEIHSIEEVVALIMFEFEDPSRPPLDVFDCNDRLLTLGPGTTEAQFRHLMINLRGTDDDFVPIATLPGSYQVGSLSAFFDEDAKLTALSVTDIHDRWCEPTPRRSRTRPEIIKPTRAHKTRVLVRTANNVTLEVRTLSPLGCFAVGNSPDSLMRRKAERMAVSQLLWWMQDPRFMAELVEAQRRGEPRRRAAISSRSASG
jgi:hypothetical protein